MIGLRRVAGLALALCLFGCGAVSRTAESPTSEPRPSGEPMGVVGYGINGEMPCEDQRAVGMLRADVRVENRLLGGDNGNPITLEVWPLDTVAWPTDVAPERFVPVRWPLEYTALRLSDGQIAVLDGGGAVVATTGRTYRLTGAWAIVAAIGGPLFGEPPWIDAFNVCRGPDAVVPG